MKYRVKGLDEYVRKLERLSDPFVAEAYMKEAIQNGAVIVRNETLKELRVLPVDNRRQAEVRTSIMSVQKAALIDSFGLSPFQDRNDFLNKKTGVSRGTNKLGQPHVTIARRLENGTSYMKKNPVFSRSSRKARKECIEEMQRSLDRAYKSLLK